MEHGVSSGSCQQRSRERDDGNGRGPTLPGEGQVRVHARAVGLSSPKWARAALRLHERRQAHPRPGV